jgi:RNA-directed DNA polymerase
MLVDFIARQLRSTPTYIAALARTASYRYKQYKIPKKSGGARIIYHPSRELKLLQTWIAHNIFGLFPVHGCAHAYVRGRSIADNAKIHQRKKYLLKIDFVDFFHSITARDIQLLLDANSSTLPMPLSPEDHRFILSIICKDDRLTIGAPSSPVVSNVVMYAFDQQWAAWDRSVLYTRYADDLFFSTDTPDLLSALLAALRRDLAMRISPRLRINESKTVFTSWKRRRLVTGLVLTSKGEISLGRRQKRYIRSLVQKYRMRILDRDGADYLRGFLAYALSVDPVYVTTLGRKYGESTVRAILSQS